MGSLGVVACEEVKMPYCAERNIGPVENMTVG
jgi:hypothetical protein